MSAWPRGSPSPEPELLHSSEVREGCQPSVTAIEQKACLHHLWWRIPSRSRQKHHTARVASALKPKMDVFAQQKHLLPLWACGPVVGPQWNGSKSPLEAEVKRPGANTQPSAACSRRGRGQAPRWELTSENRGQKMHIRVSKRPKALHLL